jgi:glycylpeptide N-tetradecanoyltransferase
MLYSAYLYYNVAGSLTITELINNLLIEANNQKKDVFFALDIANNIKFFKGLNFLQGNSDLNYYLYNYPNDLINSDINVVLV